MRKASAIAPVNIALVKYWGKRDEALNLPCTDSLSVTLSGMTSHTTVAFEEGLDNDLFVLNGEKIEGAGLDKVRRVLEVVRQRSEIAAGARIVSENNFPTGNGLASSASGLAALALAASNASGWDATGEEASRLARLGSGSACRSIHGGFVHWNRGERSDGMDSIAIPFAEASTWPLRVFVVVVDEGNKAVSSTVGMMETAKSSPYFESWINSVDSDMQAAKEAIGNRHFDALGAVAERSCLRMHAAMMGAVPPLLYWRPSTMVVLDALRSWREAGTSLFFTIDAGPNVKVFLPPDASDDLVERLNQLDGVKRVIVSEIGAGARLVDEDLF